MDRARRRERFGSRMKVLLLGSYEFDGATSIKIWANALLRQLLQDGIEARMISPKPVFGAFKRSPGGLGKWLGYIDRFILFPRVLRAAARQADVVHVCDHGSAMYVPTVKGRPAIVTCNDMLAVRGAMGELADCQASFFGRLLQRWIRRGLSRADLLVCVSRYTLDDVDRILGADREPLRGPEWPDLPFPAARSRRDRPAPCRPQGDPRAVCSPRRVQFGA